MKCVVCKKDIKEYDLKGYVFYAGCVQTIYPGYGSSHDLEEIKIGICDNCLDTAEKDNIIEILKTDMII